MLSLIIYDQENKYNDHYKHIYVQCLMRIAAIKNVKQAESRAEHKLIKMIYTLDKAKREQLRAQSAERVDYIFPSPLQFY